MAVIDVYIRVYGLHIDVYDLYMNVYNSLNSPTYDDLFICAKIVMIGNFGKCKCKAFNSVLKVGNICNETVVKYTTRQYCLAYYINN